MLLTSTTAWPASANVAQEVKHDGVRLVSAKLDGQVQCWTRHGTNVSIKLGAIRAELAALLPDDSVVDGELIALARGAGGQVGEDFNLLFQTLFSRRKHPLFLMVFDVTRIAGDQLCDRPWRERRAILEDTLHRVGPNVALRPTAAYTTSSYDSGSKDP